MPENRLFRLPSGAIVRRRNLSVGIAAQLEVGEVAYVLGARLRNLADAIDLSQAQVVKWQRVDEELAEAVQRTIGSRHPVVSLTDGDMSFRFGDFSPLSPQQTVVLLTDSLLTGRTVTRLMRIVRRMEGNPIAIAAVLDGRADCHAPVPTFGALVPVVSCLAKTVVQSNPDAHAGYVEDVDPIDRDIISRHPPISRPLSSETFLSWLRSDAESGIFIGHIDRGRARHFSTYLNVGRLVATHPEAIDALEESIISAFEPFDHRATTIRVICPGSKGEYAWGLANAVATRLTNDLGAAVHQVSAIRDIDSDWRLEAGPWRDQFFAVIVDWGAVTTATLRGLMSLAARSGASRIHAVALTSQLEEEAEWQLQSEASIVELWHRPAEHAEEMLFPQAEVSNVEVKVPVSAAIMCRVPMGMAASSECHLCQIAQQLRRYTSMAPTRLLRQHAGRKYELYRPRSRREVLRLPATDLVGGPLTPEDAADIWNVHQLLENARSSTASRAEVRAGIGSWHGSGGDRSPEAWIRLLTVEAYWLDQPPLDADDIRVLIAYACIDILEGATAPIGRRELRWQAATVLRAASKRIFVERFGELLEASVEDLVVAADLCLGMYSLLRRPYNHSWPVISQVLSALLDARDRLIERRRPDVASKDLLFTINVLHRQALEIQTQVEQPNDSVSAWHALQSSYVMPMKTHSGALTSMLVVLNAFSGPAAVRGAASSDRRPDRAYWKDVADAWAICWDFLVEAVFPYLSVLKDLFETSIARAAWPRGRELFDLNSERAAHFASEIADLEQEPDRFTPGLRRTLEAEAFTWFEGLLRAKEIPTRHDRADAFSGSLLLRLVSENPCELAHAWDLARGRAVKTGLRLARVVGNVPRGELVFCSRSLLVETFTQILDNAGGERHKAAGRPAEGVTVEVTSAIEDDYIVVRIRNNWSHSEEMREGGLSFFASELSVFGATLDYGQLDITSSGVVSSPSDWTYDVRVALRKWKDLLI